MDTYDEELELLSADDAEEEAGAGLIPLPQPIPEPFPIPILRPVSGLYARSPIVAPRPQPIPLGAAPNGIFPIRR